MIKGAILIALIFLSVSCARDYGSKAYQALVGKDNGKRRSVTIESNNQSPCERKLLFVSDDEYLTVKAIHWKCNDMIDEFWLNRYGIVQKVVTYWKLNPVTLKPGSRFVIIMASPIKLSDTKLGYKMFDGTVEVFTPTILNLSDKQAQDLQKELEDLVSPHVLPHLDPPPINYKE